MVTHDQAEFVSVWQFLPLANHRRIGRFDRSRAAVRLQTFFPKTPTRPKLFWPTDFFRLSDFFIFTVGLQSDYSGTKVWQTTGHEDA